MIKAHAHNLHDYVLYHNESKALDIVVTIFSNYSIVSAISSLLDYDERNHTHLIKNMIYPQKHGLPVFSATGKYSVRLHVNGTFRKVDIDDDIPIDSESSFPVCLTTDRIKCLWPSLIEKAIFKLYSCSSMNLKTNPCYEVFHMSG
jgi:hypothetical protein